VLVMEDLQELQNPQVVQSLADALASPLSALNPPAQHMPASLLPPPVDEAPLDEELLEVFLEETDEVLITLHDCLPQWAANPADSAALSRAAAWLSYPQGQRAHGACAGAGGAGVGGRKPA
jgi:chemosensory pili system protein ChpA (sensor histidine kinase/response regulator)